MFMFLVKIRQLIQTAMYRRISTGSSTVSSDLLDDEIIDALLLEAVCHGLGDENTQHHWDDVVERRGKFDDDDGKRDSRPRDASEGGGRAHLAVIASIRYTSR